MELVDDIELRIGAAAREAFENGRRYQREQGDEKPLGTVRIPKRLDEYVTHSQQLSSLASVLESALKRIEKLDARANEQGEVLALLSKGLGSAERHCERNEERIDAIMQGKLSPTQLVPDMLKRLDKLEPRVGDVVIIVDDLARQVVSLESGKRGETAGYQEQNKRIGELERSTREAHDKLAATGRQLDRRIQGVVDQLSGAAQSQLSAQFANAMHKQQDRIGALERRTAALEERTIGSLQIGGNRGAPTPRKDVLEGLTPVPGLTLDRDES